VRYRIRKKIIQWFWFWPDRHDDLLDDDEARFDRICERHDRILGLLAPALRLLARHEPIRDQCNRPEHDFCIWCRKLMPGMAREGK